MSSPLIYSFAHRGLVMQGSAAAAKSSLTSKSAAGALVFSSLACNTIPSHAEAASDVDANSVLQACEATLTDRASAWDVFLRPIFSAFHPSEFAKTFIYNLVLHVSIVFNQYMVELLNHEQVSIDAEAEGLQAPDPPPIPDFKPAFTRAWWGSVRDMCKKAVTRLFQGIVIVKVGFTRSQAIIRDPFPWLRNNLIPKLKDAPKPEVFKQTFSLLMHTNALLFAAEWTVSVVQASYKIIRSRGTNAKAKSMQIVRSLVAQWVRCKILYLITSVGGALAVSLYPAASRMMLQGGILLSDLVIGIMISPLIQIISG